MKDPHINERVRVPQRKSLMFPAVPEQHTGYTMRALALGPESGGSQKWIAGAHNGEQDGSAWFTQPKSPRSWS